MFEKQGILYFLLLAVIALSNADNTDEQSAEQLLQQINEVYWQNAATYRHFADDTFSPEILIRAKLLPYYETLQRYNWQQFRSAQLRRQFVVLLRGVKYPPIDYKFKKATQTLKTMSRKKWACPRNETTTTTTNKCNLAFVHQIKTIFTNSDDLDEIKYYWQEWRNKMPQDIKNALHEYIDYYKQLSIANSVPASAIWYDQYEDPNFITELEELMETIRPLYNELHAHLRHVLRVKYGTDVVPETGLIPHHLMEQVTYQAWKKESVLRNPFPQKKLPNLQAEMDKMSYTSFDLVNISVQFFSSIGMSNFTDDFMQANFKPIEAGNAGPDCKSRIFDFGETELNYCPKVYYKKLLQSHGDIAQIQYALVKNNKLVGLNSEACPGFGNAIGEAVILSASTPKHLQQHLGLLRDYDYDDLLNLNRLYRLAAHTLLTLPTYFVHEKLWVDMIDAKITPSEYNCRYWNLMEQYMGVDAPVQTNTDAYDMPYKFYEGILEQSRSTKKLVGEFLGYQIYRAICLKIGQYERYNAYKTLDNCDFSQHKEAGALLSELMSSGSSLSWREIVQILTVKRFNRLLGTPFLEYFNSLHEWLRDDNLNKNLHVGWSSTDKCKASAGKQ